MNSFIPDSLTGGGGMSGVVPPGTDRVLCDQERRHLFIGDRESFLVDSVKESSFNL